MDSYPEALAPTFTEGGAVETPFAEWWARTRLHFRDVPDEVAEDWLHRHWSHSPFGWIPSAQYTFRRSTWPSKDLKCIRSGWNNFNADHAENLEHGRYLVEVHRSEYGHGLSDYMVEHGAFPVPPVIMDNRDGHLAGIPGAHFPFPSGHLLIEGHCRFNIALFLAQNGGVQDHLSFWLMERR